MKEVAAVKEVAVKEVQGEGGGEGGGLEAKEEAEAGRRTTVQK